MRYLSVCSGIYAVTVEGAFVTIIVAAKGTDGIWIGSDRRSVRDHYPFRDGEPKWQTGANVTIGNSGYSRGTYLIEPLLATRWENVWDLCLAIRKTLMDDGWRHDDEKSAPINYGPGFIIILQDTIWFPDGGLTPAQFGNFAAAGSGAQYAYGAAYALNSSPFTPQQTPERVVRVAIAAAIAHDENCGGDPWVRKL